MSDATANSGVDSILVEDGVDSDLDVRVKVLNHQLTAEPEDRLLHLSYPAEPARGFSIDVGMLRRVLAAVDTPSEVDADGGPAVTALDLPAAALRGIDSVNWPDGPAGVGKPMVELALSLRMQVTEAAAREVMAEVTRVLAAVRDQAESYPDSTVATGAVVGINRAAGRLGVDLDAALAKEEL